MAVKSERFDGRPERMVVAACVANKAVLAGISAIWTPNALPSRASNLIIGWAVEYYREWKRSPAADIQNDYDTWRVDAKDPAMVEMVGSLLQSVSDDYRQIRDSVNPEYVLKCAALLMNRVRLVETNAKIASLLEAGELDRATSEFSKYRPVLLGGDAWIDLKDTEALAALVTATLADRVEPLIKYPDALGNFFGRAMERNGFVSFLGYKKGQKSFWMQDLAWRALEQGRSVAYFEAGDMSKGQLVVDRLAVRALGRPIKGDPDHAYEIPTAIDVPTMKQGAVQLEHKRVWYKRPASQEQMVQALSKLSLDGPGRFRISPHPARTLSVPGIESILTQWEDADGFVPSVIVVDYADILAPVDKKFEGLDRINETWIALRSLSQKKNALVVTATQARRDSQHKTTMDQTDVSDETRKLAHVTAMYGINRNSSDISKGLWRLNPIVDRYSTLSMEDVVYTAGSLDFCNPAMVSSF